LLAEIAQLTEVSIYFLSPSEGYWGDLLNQKSQAKQRLLFDDEDDFTDNGHPLLASLGKLGQTFFEQLQAIPHEAEMLYLQPQATDILSQLKQDIYQLDNADELVAVASDDDSVQIHSCHSAMREAEVLHDQLLNLFEKHPNLSPTDVVVMTPDIEVYAPAIEAVFSSQPAERFIPFSIANRGDAQQQTIIETFTDLLGLPQSRFDAETIMRLLECTAIQRQFRLDHTDLDTIRGWLRQTQIRWGLDGKDKQALGLPALDANTWRAGLDRLLLGYALPPAERDQWQLFNAQLPVGGISGDRAQLMAQLNAFIDQLSQLRNELKRPRTPSDWQILLMDWLRKLFSVREENEQLQLDAILKAIEDAGYHIEKDAYSPNTMVASFPVHEPFFQKGKDEATMWEQLEIAAAYQHYWADNSVSVTVTFKGDEAKDIKTALEMYESRLKAVSFLRYQETGYEQAPYEPITKEQYEEMSKDIVPIQRIETEVQGAGTVFCDGDSCEIA